MRSEKWRMRNAKCLLREDHLERIVEKRNYPHPDPFCIFHSPFFISHSSVQTHQSRSLWLSMCFRNSAVAVATSPFARSSTMRL